MLSRKVLVVIVAAICLTASVRQIGACTCPMRPPVAKATETSDLVLRGTVVQMVNMSDSAACRTAAQGVPPPPDDFIALCGLAVTIRVDAVWKGPREVRVTFVTGHGGPDCGAEFAKGKRYVVFARKLKTGTFYTDGCTYTGEATGRTDVISDLGQPLWEPSA